MNRRKKAFTLTELLVVVIIIGVLSAVVLPKFTKVLETRKTSEAENIMASVRSEQEARCMLGKDYTGDTSKLASLPSGSSKHFNYTLNAQGITATAASGKYVLAIPSYTDGRICCVSGCDELNKNYPSCDKLDLEQATCSVPPDEKPNPPTCDVPTQNTKTITEECGCNKEGTKTGTSTFDVESCSWSEYEWDQCSVKETDCDDKCDKEEMKEEPCPDGQDGKIYYRLNKDACEYKEESRSCKFCNDEHVEGGQEFEGCGCVYQWHCATDTNYEWERKMTQACAERPADETRECMEGTGTQTRTYKCKDGKYIPGEWEGECTDSLCNGTPLAERECEAGRWGEGGNTCTVLLSEDIDTEDHDSSTMTEPENNSGSKEEDYPGNNEGQEESPSYQTVTFQAGRICNDFCKWYDLACPPRRGGGDRERADENESHWADFGKWKEQEKPCFHQESLEICFIGAGVTSVKWYH